MILFDELLKIFDRPEPFEHYTAKELWTDKHLAQQMLKFHLDPDVDLSSRKRHFIEQSVKWIVTNLVPLKGSRVADFGCGPGLYANRLAKHGLDVTGIDFSINSISYARERAKADGLSVKYVNADYLEFRTDEKYDLIIMIMCDYCALSPVKRRLLLGKFHSMLREDGQVLLDVYSMNAFDSRHEAVTCAKNLLNGFWSADDYFGFLNTFKYTSERVILDKYTIIEPYSTRTFYNWLQYYSPAALLEEFRIAGFCEKILYADVAGTPFEDGSSEFAIIARKG